VLANTPSTSGAGKRKSDDNDDGGVKIKRVRISDDL
jgi:hypothetical protein